MHACMYSTVGRFKNKKKDQKTHHGDDRALVVSEEILEPGDRVGVEVVRRLSLQFFVILGAVVLWR